MPISLHYDFLLLCHLLPSNMCPRNQRSYQHTQYGNLDNEVVNEREASLTSPPLPL